MRYPELDDYNVRMERIVETFVRRAVEGNQDGVFRLMIDNFRSTADNAPLINVMLIEMLSSRPEIEYVELFDDELVFKMATEYSNCESSEYRKLEKEEVDVMCALHTLWLHDSGGEQANFSGCEIRDVDMRCKPLPKCIINGAKFVNCNFEKNNMKELLAEGVVFSNCSFYDTMIEDSNFKKARFYNTQFTATQIVRTNLTDAVVQGCPVSAFEIKESCLQNVKYDNKSRSWCGKNECVEDEDWWLNRYRSNAKMIM